MDLLNKCELASGQLCEALDNDPIMNRLCEEMEHATGDAYDALDVQYGARMAVVEAEVFGRLSLAPEVFSNWVLQQLCDPDALAEIEALLDAADVREAQEEEIRRLLAS